MTDKKAELEKVVGKENITDDAPLLDLYAKDNSFSPVRKPRLIVKPANIDEVQKVVEWANNTATPLVPVSSGAPHSRGDTVPSVPEAVIVDLSRMKSIMRINRRNRMTYVEPGVTFGELQPALEKEGLRLNAPLLPRQNKSVIGSLLEREPVMIPRYQWNMADPLRSLGVIWGNGEKFVTGDAGLHPIELADQWKRHLAQVQGMGPGQIDYHRLLQGSQGTMGIVTWAAVRCELLPVIRKFYLAPAKKLDSLIDLAYRILRFRFCDEILFFNNFELASILRDTPDKIKELSEKLPPWTLIIGTAGRERLPKERVEFLDKDIRQFAQQIGVELFSEIPGASDLEIQEAILGLSREPQWKLSNKSGNQDIFFITTLDRVNNLIGTMNSAAEENGFPLTEIGTYIQPVQQGVSCHCEFSLNYDQNNKREVEKVQVLYASASKALLDKGAYFSRPYGIWSDMVYNRDAQSTTVLKKIKDIFDPNHVLNPGKLCY